MDKYLGQARTGNGIERQRQESRTGQAVGWDVRDKCLDKDRWWPMKGRDNCLGQDRPWPGKEGTSLGQDRHWRGKRGTSVQASTGSVFGRERQVSRHG